MKRLVYLGLALSVSAISLAALGAVPPFARGPYSGAPTEDSVVISWVVASALPAELEVAPVARDSRGVSAARKISVAAPLADEDGQVDILVDDLVPATSYIYQVTLQSGPEIVSSPIGHFTTAPLAGERTTFAVLADTQWQWEGANRLAVVAGAIAFDSARHGGFDFVLHAGDLVETPNNHYWPHWFASFEPMLLAAPFIPVLGNHEKNSISYYNAFSHPSGAGQNNERWWTLHWGDLVIVGLDTAATRADRILEQQAYARTELAGDERWKFVIFHHPVFSSDAYHGSGYGYELIYHPIFVESGVDVVFNGHAHNYERIEKDGVVYLVLGGGGAVPRPLASERVDGSVIAIENRNFYARVSTSPDELSVDIVSVAEAGETTFRTTSDELLDSFSLHAPAQPAAAPPRVTPPAAMPMTDGELPPPPASEPEGPQLETTMAQITTEIVATSPVPACEPVLVMAAPQLPPVSPAELPAAPAAPAPAEVETCAVGGLSVRLILIVVALAAAVALLVLR